MDFDFLMVGTEREYLGKKYLFIKSVNAEYDLVVEVGAELPAQALVIPRRKLESENIQPASNGRELQ